MRRFPPVPGIDIGTAFLLPENDGVGGDLVDVYRFNNGSVAISVADISGKGRHAASHAALVKYGLRAYVSAGLTPAQVLRNLNVLYIETIGFENAEPNSFASVFLGVIDFEHRVMTYASAGHEPAILMTPQRFPELLPPTAPIVGVFEDMHKLFHQRLVALPPGGSTLILATDGVTEARAPNGHFIKESDIMKLIESNRSLPAREQADRLLRSTRRFSGGRAQDDIAVLVARFP